MGGKLAIALEHWLVTEDRQRFQRHPAGQRVAGVAVRVQESLAGVVLGVERGIDLAGREYRRQRQEAASESLRQAHEVGRHAGPSTRLRTGLLAGEQGAGAA